ncbi:hypothetical protein I4555_12100 [Proteus mirabilis]|nr:hypothetical protein [Proteus mirabilis]MBG6014032.1 hypothetical protein [Proteus mirabilis]MBI6473146.1 hypothetical protein [Proteus mirabilis]MBI6508683.1 hypothetical protein [Proteus mirabilis]HDU8677081.1 hypothetical protein [Proteus mirabilis]
MVKYLNGYYYLLVNQIGEIMEVFDFKKFWNSLTIKQREAFSQRTGYSQLYLSHQLRYAKRKPSLSKFNKLYDICVEFGADATREQLINFFIR